MKSKNAEADGANLSYALSASWAVSVAIVLFCFVTFSFPAPAQATICVGDSCGKRFDSGGPAKASEQDAPSGQDHGVLTVLRPAFEDSDRIAMVIGNASYVDAPKLSSPVNDAAKLGDILKSMGFIVYRIENAKHSDFPIVLQSFIAAAAGKKMALLYYSGHGVQINGRNYMVPIDAPLLTNNSVAENFVSQLQDVDEILSLVSNTVPIRILLFDSCRNNPFAANNTRAVSVKENGLARMDTLFRDVFIGFATQPDGVALDTMGDSGHSPFALALMSELPKANRPIESMFTLVTKDVAEMTNGAQIPWMNASLTREVYLNPNQTEAPISEDTVNIDGSLVGQISKESFSVNGSGRFLASDGIISAQSPQTLGALKPGFNLINIAGRNILAWYERHKLAAFENPYKKSYAIVIAIDRYSEEKQGVARLGKMVPDAEILSERLQQLDFPKENIFKLYNEDATSDKIEAMFKNFWLGGPYAKADRLIVYFGGHGGSVDIPDKLPEENRKRGYLITYDFDPQRPTQQAILMDDIVEKQFRYMAPRQIAFFIDACSSGLALATSLGNPRTDDDEARLGVLATIYSEAGSRARDIMVAGTGVEDAAYDFGGVFSRALIDGLGGEADVNHSGLITFSQLVVFVKARVEKDSILRGETQRPANATSGEILFFKTF